MKLQVLVNEGYAPTYDDRRRQHLSRFTDAELRRKIERIANVLDYGKNRAKLSERMRQRLDTRLETMSAEDLGCYATMWDIADSITRQERLQYAIVSLIKAEQRIRRISDELRERMLDRPRFRLLVNDTLVETDGMRRLRANMRAFDRRNKGDN